MKDSFFEAVSFFKTNETPENDGLTVEISKTLWNPVVKILVTSGRLFENRK